MEENRTEPGRTPLPAGGLSTVVERSGPSIAGHLTFVALFIGVVHLVSLTSYLLFHSLVELFSVIIALTVFTIGWNTRRFSQNDSLLLLAVAYLAVGSIDLLHTLSYRELGLFTGAKAEVPVQLWAAARLMEAGSLAAGALLVGRSPSLRPWWLLGGYLFLALGVVLTIVPLGIFPECFEPGGEPTRFKRLTEIGTSLLLLVSATLFWLRRRHIDRPILALLLLAVAAKLFSEVGYAVSFGEGGPFPVLGHTFKLGSILLIYGALIQGVLKTPYRSLFKDLYRSERRLKRELTERRKAEDALRESTARYQALIDISPSGIVENDLQGIVTFSNRAHHQMLGYEPGELVGKPIWETLPSEEAQEELSGYLQYLAAEQPPPTVFEASNLTKDGRLIDLRTDWAYKRDEGGEVVGFVSVLTDVTERRQAEQQLRAANKELDAFVYTVSHDLRSPLTPIIGFAEHLRQTYADRLDREALEALDTISGQGERMLALMEDLLALARVERPRLPERPVSVAEVVAEALGELNEERQSSGLEVRVGELPEVRLPATQLYQVFANLIGNALRYAGAEGGPVEVGGVRRGNRVWFHVRDHGPGISEGDAERIFTVFHRGRTGNKRPGTGIGLAIVAKIARLHGGKAWVTRTAGGGASFWVEMVDAEPDGEIA